MTKDSFVTFTVRNNSEWWAAELLPDMTFNIFHICNKLEPYNIYIDKKKECPKCQTHIIKPTDSLVVDKIHKIDFNNEYIYKEYLIKKFKVEPPNTAWDTDYFILAKAQTVLDDANFRLITYAPKFSILSHLSLLSKTDTRARYHTDSVIDDKGKIILSSKDKCVVCKKKIDTQNITNFLFLQTKLNPKGDRI